MPINGPVVLILTSNAGIVLHYLCGILYPVSPLFSILTDVLTNKMFALC